MNAQSFIHVLLLATPWTVACQAPLAMGFPRQEYWIGLPFPPPGHLPRPRIEPISPEAPELAGGVFTTRTTWEAMPSLLLPINEQGTYYICNGLYQKETGVHKTVWNDYQLCQ